MTYAIKPDVAAAVTDLYGNSASRTVFLAEDGFTNCSPSFDIASSVAETVLDNVGKTVSPIDYTTAQASLAQLTSLGELDITPQIFMSAVQGIIESGFSRQEAVSLIGSFSALRRSNDPPVEDSVSQSTMSERSIRRMNYRNACRSKHEEPGYCYLAPVAWKDRTDIAESLGENPTIEQVLNVYSENFSVLRDWTSYYVIKVSSADTGKYHFTRNPHQSVGTLAGLVNGLKTRWAASGSSVERFSELPRTTGHTEFTVPLRARVGYSGYSDRASAGHDTGVSEPSTGSLPDNPAVSTVPGTLVRTVDSTLVNFSAPAVTPPMSTDFTRHDDNSYLSIAHYGDFKTYTFCVRERQFGYGFLRFLDTIPRTAFLENDVVDQLLDNLFSISDSIINYRGPDGRQWLINCDAELYRTLAGIFCDCSDDYLNRSSIKVLEAIVYSLRDAYAAMTESTDIWFLSPIGIAVFSKLLSE